MLPSTASATSECSNGNKPGATLLFPYFEVDLADPKGLKTLISIHNTSDEAILTNVVMWTNCGLPALSFNLVLGGQAMQSIDVYDLANGKIPISDEPTSFPGCADPIAQSNLTVAQRLSLRARLTGQPDPADGLCYAASSDTAIAHGFITVDVVQECSETIRTPHHQGYFATEDGPGIADNANILWGDFFLLDDQGNLAQGFEAIAVVADPPSDTPYHRGFYQRGDDRRRLSSRYRTRFLQGGHFDGGTELLTWVAPQVYGPFGCFGGGGCPLGFGAYAWEFVARNEAGELSAQHKMYFSTSTARHKVGSEEFPIEANFGTLDFQFYFYGCRSRKCTPPGGGPVQGWLLPLYTAADRYSVGLRAVAMDDPCSQ